MGWRFVFPDGRGRLSMLNVNNCGTTTSCFESSPRASGAHYYFTAARWVATAAIQYAGAPSWVRENLSNSR